MRINGHQALALVRADLGRDPQDPLEATISLESTGGIVGPTAVDLGRRAAKVARQDGAPLARRQDVRDRLPWNAPAAVGLVFISLLWAHLLIIGGSDLDPSGVLVGLPVGLTLVGYLDRRFVAGDDGPRRLRARLGEVGVTIAVVCLVVGFGPGGQIAVGVILVQVCTTFAARVNVAAPVITVIGVGYAFGTLGDRPMVAAFVSLAVALVIVIFRVLRVPPLMVPPNRFASAVPRAVAGLGLGLLTVPVIQLTTRMGTSPPLIVILPATVAGALAAGFLERMWLVVADLLDQLPVGRRPDRQVGRVYARLVIGGALAGGLATVLLSWAVYANAAPIQGRRGVEALVVMGAIASVSYWAMVLQGVGGERPAAIGLLAAGSLAVLGSNLADRPATAVVLAVVLLHVAWLPLLLLILRDPERVLAAKL
ncbi:MAG: hypothetical protein KF906_07615 [Actinobacteria bacterium]|nr:hypothetical protein [Actinomycetota bacterium]